jgi:phosphomevalonate kinase
VRARAPGKLVLSGAYAVLEGAPAIVSAVDRYVTADAGRRADFITPEVRAALGATTEVPWFDAGSLREQGEKLGLGSSAAILVASLAAHALLEHGPLDDFELAELVFAPALRAHAQAQGGGSGVDVAAAAFGGTLVFHRARPEAGTTAPEAVVAPVSNEAPASLNGSSSDPDGRAAAAPSIVRSSVPAGIVVETWWSGRPATTADFVRRVKALSSREPTLFAERMGAQVLAAEQATHAALAGHGAAFIAALNAQRSALHALGAAAEVSIITEFVVRLAAAAPEAAVLPAGAGGGDIVLHVGAGASSPSFRGLAAELGHRLIPLALGARGVHAVSVD